MREAVTTFHDLHHAAIDHLCRRQPFDALGFKNVLRPISTSCADHMGSAWARVHTWDGTKFVWASDWLQADDAIIRPMVKASAEKYTTEKKLQRRVPADCQS